MTAARGLVQGRHTATGERLQGAIECCLGPTQADSAHAETPPPKGIATVHGYDPINRNR